MNQRNEPKKVHLFSKKKKLNMGKTWILIIIIITLCQEAKLFGMIASLKYGPQLKRLTCHWQLNKHKLLTVCTEQVRSPYTEHAASGLPNPTHLEGVRFVQAQEQVDTTLFLVTCSVRIVKLSVYSLAWCWLKYMYMIFTVNCVQSFSLSCPPLHCWCLTH